MKLKDFVARWSGSELTCTDSEKLEEIKKSLLEKSSIPLQQQRLTFRSPPGVLSRVSIVRTSTLDSCGSEESVQNSGAASQWQGILFQNNKAIGKLVLPRLSYTGPVAYQLSAGDSEGRVDCFVQVVTLFYEQWLPALHKKGVADFKQLHLLVDPSFKAAEFRVQLFGADSLAQRFLVPLSFQFSGKEVAAAIDYHTQRTAYIEQQRLRRGESVAAPPALLSVEFGSELHHCVAVFDVEGEPHLSRLVFSFTTILENQKLHVRGGAESSSPTTKMQLASVESQPFSGRGLHVSADSSSSISLNHATEQTFSKESSGFVKELPKAKKSKRKTKTNDTPASQSGSSTSSSTAEPAEADSIDRPSTSTDLVATAARSGSKHSHVSLRHDEHPSSASSYKAASEDSDTGGSGEEPEALSAAISLLSQTVTTRGAGEDVAHCMRGNSSALRGNSLESYPLLPVITDQSSTSSTGHSIDVCSPPCFSELFPAGRTALPVVLPGVLTTAGIASGTAELQGPTQQMVPAVTSHAVAPRANGVSSCSELDSEGLYVRSDSLGSISSSTVASGGSTRGMASSKLRSGPAHMEGAEAGATGGAAGRSEAGLPHVAPENLTDPAGSFWPQQVNGYGIGRAPSPAPGPAAGPAPAHSSHVQHGEAAQRPAHQPISRGASLDALPTDSGRQSPRKSWAGSALPNGVLARDASKRSPALNGANGWYLGARDDVLPPASSGRHARRHSGSAQDLRGRGYGGGSDAGNITDMERFLVQACPVLRTSPAQGPDQFCLEDVWRTYEECSLHGAEVQALGGPRGPSQAYYVPFLSAVQLFVPAGIDSVKAVAPALGAAPAAPPPGKPQLYYQFFEHDQPHLRSPLLFKALDLAELADGARLLETPLAHLHPASWYAVAWYPIYRIPDAPLNARFLTYHSFAVRKLTAAGSSSALPAPHQGSDRDMFLLPLIGAKWNNHLRGERWFDQLPAALPHAGDGAAELHLLRTMLGTTSADSYGWRAVLEPLQRAAEGLSRGDGTGQGAPHDRQRWLHPDFSFFNREL